MNIGLKMSGQQGEPHDNKSLPAIFLAAAGLGAVGYFWRQRLKASSKSVSKDEGRNNASKVFSDKEIVQHLENEILRLQAKLEPASNYEKRVEEIEEELELLRIEKDIYKSELLQFHLKIAFEYSQRKSMETEADSLKVEYQQRVSSLERKVYALTKERDDALRREQNTKSDASALLKEKDEIIIQVMSEGEVLSKKQDDQDAIIRELRAQIREFKEETQRLNSKLQMEEAKVENIKAQKEFYTSALTAAKEAEAEAVAESSANRAIKNKLETQLKEAAEKEMVLVLNIEQLRRTMTRKEQEAAIKEKNCKRDIDDIQEIYQASELRYNELVTRVSTQIEAMQETAVRRAEAWAGVERSLNSRLQEAEAKAAAAEENERSLNERLLKEKDEIISQFTAEGEKLSKKHAAQEATIQKLHSQIQERDDALRREQNKKSDAAALLKEKDETIAQLMAEGKELSKKQAAQEATIQKLCAQIQKFEDKIQIDTPPAALVLNPALAAPTPTPTLALTHLPTSPEAAFGAVAHGRIGGEVDAEELQEIKQKQKQIGGMQMEEGKLAGDLGETVGDAPPLSLTLPTPPAQVTTPTPTRSISLTPTSAPTHLPTSPGAAFGAVPDGRIGEIDPDELHKIKRKQKQIGGITMEEGNLTADLGQRNGHFLDKVPPTPVPTLQSPTQFHGLTDLLPQSHGPTLPSPHGPTHLPTPPVLR